MNDIFISYAHIDNEALTEEDKGWISQFHKVLDTRVAQLTGEKPRIWRDLKLGGNDMFDKAIVHQFNCARVMISIMSPRYLKSEWCMKELKQFYENASSTSGVSFENKSRILKVVKTPFETNDVPNEIRGVFASLLGFEFFEVDPKPVSSWNITLHSGPTRSTIISQRFSISHMKSASCSRQCPIKKQATV